MQCIVDIILILNVYLLLTCVIQWMTAIKKTTLANWIATMTIFRTIVAFIGLARKWNVIFTNQVEATITVTRQRRWWFVQERRLSNRWFSRLCSNAYRIFRPGSWLYVAQYNCWIFHYKNNLPNNNAHSLATWLVKKQPFSGGFLSRGLLSVHHRAFW